MEPYAGDQFSQSQKGVPIGPPDPSKPKLLDQARAILRLHHYSIHTERSYLDWIRRYVRFHGMKCRDDLADGYIDAHHRLFVRTEILKAVNR